MENMQNDSTQGGRVRHTPGPWKLYLPQPGDKEFQIIAGDGYYEGSTFNVDFDDVDHDLAIANATLACAAPDLLEALKAMRRLVSRQLLGEGVSHETWDGTVTKAEAAIAKAEEGL